MTTVTRPGRRFADDCNPSGPASCGRSGPHRADYLYVLPAIVVMLIVIAYPIYYTIDLSFFKTPPGLQLRDKIFVGFDNYTPILTSDVFWRVTLNTVIWTLASTFFAFVLGLGARARAASRLSRPRRAARHPDHSLGHQRGRRLLYLEVDLPFRFRHHRRGSGRPRHSPTGRPISSTTSAPFCPR